MSEFPLQNLINLVDFDQSLNKISADIDKLEQELDKLEIQEIEYDQTVQARKNSLALLRKDVDLQERVMKELEKEAQEKKHRLDTSASHKEYQAIKNEIDAVRRKQYEHEETLLQVWNRYETMQQLIDKQEKEHQDKREQLKTEADQRKKSIAGLENTLQQDLLKRPALEQLVPAEWLEKYALMRSRVSNPIVAVINGNCSACFYNITNQDMLNLERRKLIQCRDCYRFLYLESANVK